MSRPWPDPNDPDPGRRQRLAFAAEAAILAILLAAALLAGLIAAARAALGV